MSLFAIIALALILARTVTELWLSRLNQRHVRTHRNEVPPVFRGVMDESTYRRSVDYTLARSRFGNIVNVFDAAMLVAVLFSGVLPWAWSFSLSGPAAVHFINQVYLDKVFLNVVGLDVERGATTLEADEAVIFRAMQRQARGVIAVADHTKLGQVSPALICPVQEIHMLVTDTGATDAMIAPFEQRGIKVLRV